MTTLAVSVSEFKTHCLDVIRQVEQTGAVIDLTRHGKVVAKLMPSMPSAQGVPAWLRLRGQGKLIAAPDETVLDDLHLDALSYKK